VYLAEMESSGGLSRRVALKLLHWDLDPVNQAAERMRDEAPVYRDRRFMGWILARYDDVLAVLRDPRVSSQRPLASEPVGRSLAPIATEVREIRQFQGRWMMHLDPPEHTRLRTLVSKAFTATRVEALRETIQALTTLATYLADRPDRAKLGSRQ